jgi:hypothetical protein
LETLFFIFGILSGAAIFFFFINFRTKGFQSQHKEDCVFNAHAHVAVELSVLANFSSPFFLFLAWQPSWLEVGITGHNFGRGPSKDHSSKVWSKLAQWFLGRRLKCEKLTTTNET